jgi:hypothetical protein
MVAPVEIGKGGIELLVGNGLLKQHQADDRHAVGAALWAAKRITEQRDQFAFPKYCSQAECKANSASATLNKLQKASARRICKEALFCLKQT